MIRAIRKRYLARSVAGSFRPDAVVGLAGRGDGAVDVGGVGLGDLGEDPPHWPG
jgi:hypothetical protein